MHDHIENRIVGHDNVAPDQLLANPRNFRRHPGRQRDALRGSLNEVGWVKSIIVNRTTGHVIDGHARVEEALRQGLATVPVTYIEVDADEEALLLAVLDPMAEMAVHDDIALRELIAEVETEDAALQELVDSIESTPRAAGTLTVEEAKFGTVEDGFWMSIRGPLPRQMAVLEKLRAAINEIPGVEIEIGTTA